MKANRDDSEPDINLTFYFETFEQASRIVLWVEDLLKSFPADCDDTDTIRWCDIIYNQFPHYENINPNYDSSFAVAHRIVIEAASDQLMVVIHSILATLHGSGRK